MRCNKVCSTLISILLLAAIAAAAYFALKAMRAHQLRVNPEQAREAGRPMPVATWPVEFGDLDWRVGAECLVQPSRVVLQGSGISEPLTRIAVEVGQEVQRGDVLLEADSARLEVEVRNVVAGEVEAERLVADLSPFLKSIREEEHKKLMRIADVVQVVNAAGQARAQLARLKLESALLKYKLQHLNVVAQIDGVVTSLDAVLGAEPRDFASLVEISVLDPVHAHCAFAQEDYAVVRAHSQAVLTLPAFQGERFDAGFEKLLPAVDGTDPSLEAVFAVSNPGYRLLPGMGALIRLGRSEPGLRVPAIALIGPLEGHAQVFVVDDGIARLREIEVGPYADGFVQVKAGLEEGERVVLAGQVHLLDGDLVREDPQRTETIPGLFPAPAP